MNKSNDTLKSLNFGERFFLHPLQGPAVTRD